MPGTDHNTPCSERITHATRLCRWTGAQGGNWFYCAIDGEAGEALATAALVRRLEGMARGFGSLRVTAQIGETRWQTSVFPQKGGGWLLLVKAAVRKAEGIGEGDEVELTLEF